MKLVIATLMVCGMSFAAHAEETMGEKATATKNDVKRGLKKAGNRVAEAVCAEGDVKCAAKKAGNRIEETKDKAVDAVKAGADKVDSNNKSNH